MGRDKALLDLGGEALVRRCVSTVATSGIDEISVVVNPHNQASIAHAVRGLPVRVVCNPRHSQGMGTSIATAAAMMACDSIAAGLLLVLVDQPLIDASMLAAIVDAWLDARPDFVASAYGGVTTTPVLFDRSLLPELRALAGDGGARAILQSHAANGRILEFPPWRGRDIDTADDYAAVREILERGARVAHDGKQFV
jgi:molybdenum cofactor cytidylyltransferase